MPRETPRSGGPNGSVHRRPVPQPHIQQLVDRREYPPPHRLTVQIASVEHGVGVHGGVDRRFRTVLIHEQAGGRANVRAANYLARQIAYI